tara:strand:+ start:4432 stop:4815 length:384 start_codon:yes stop_codon:yes gene_type:complete
MKKIKSNKAPRAIGPYSQAVISNGFVFTSGQIGIDPKTNDFHSRDFEIEANQVFNNIEAILKDSGSSFDYLIKMNIFLTDLSNFDKLNKIMREIFDNNNLPSRSTIEVSSLPKGAAIEIDVIAELAK